MTNFDKIKKMTVDEMADFLQFVSECSFDHGRGFGDCTDCEYKQGKTCPCDEPKKWLEKRARK